jgi:hypothetical protein
LISVITRPIFFVLTRAFSFATIWRYPGGETGKGNSKKQLLVTMVWDIAQVQKELSKMAFEVVM